MVFVNAVPTPAENSMIRKMIRSCCDVLASMAWSRETKLRVLCLLRAYRNHRQGEI